MSDTTLPLPATAPLATPRVLAVRAFGKTDRGLVRPNNEDRYLVAELPHASRLGRNGFPGEAAPFDRGHLLLVADGMGGHQGGEVASALAVASIEAFVLDLLRRVFRLQPTDEQAVLRDFQQALQRADARIVEEAAASPELAGMGTTLTLAFATGASLFVFHVGDSRCYLLRGGVLERLTRDHTVAAELARRGVIGPEEVKGHPRRNTITNVLGGYDAGVDVEVHRVELEAGDVVLLCTDGLSDLLDEGRLAAELAAGGEVRPACKRLVAAALEAGGRDNVTAIVARFDAEPN